MAYPQTYAPRPSRPVGVAILAILVILAGVLLAVVAFLGLFVGGLVAIVAPGDTLLLIVSGILLILAIILLASGFGLWHLRPWAWWLAVIVVVLDIVFEVSTLGIRSLRGLELLSTSQLITIGFPVLILIYLVAVRHHFRRQPSYTAPARPPAPPTQR